MSSWQIFTLGFAAQLLFTGRFLFQWIASEKAKKVVTPSLFWKLSLLGSFLLFLYGVLRNDPAIIFGQVLIFGIYIRNLQLQGEWKKISRHFRFLILVLPIITIIFFSFSRNHTSEVLFFRNNISNWLLILGFIGQITFALRFVVQWLYSEKVKISILPLPFWILSITGSVLILIYAVFRKDPVLFIGHLAGIFIYIRNINLSRHNYASG
ncbi:lipid-A-disaccharide synthase N-terminal domain-containing protein [Salinimicrobium terrae]|uniref:lipid-A-disaccharide synthase N-terminal domain-containing protein n=1 Tax=Salinimicrobium terrae TaxID=470866 RepID=UPI0003FE5979|nr:lipid-A-disaccharide synthase N-terminal domain-containing protein [Salinimicrobium terrae]